MEVKTEIDIQKWIDDRLGVLNTFNKQLLIDFLAHIREVVEGEYNPFNEPECEEDSNRYSGFEVARQAVLKTMEEEKASEI